MPAQKSQHSLLYRVLGAARVVAKNRQIQRSLHGLTAASRRLRAGMVGMRSSLAGAGAGLVALGMGFMGMIRQFERYTTMQSRVRTTLAAQGMQMRNVTGEVTSFAEAVGRRLGYSLEESNEGLMTLLQTGQDIHQVMRLMPSTMRLARVADLETAQATRFLVDTTELFRREMLETEHTVDGTTESLQQFANRMSGQLAVSAYSTATNVEDLQQAFRYAGTELSAMGYNSREVMSALAGLSTVGLRSTTAGTRLRGAMLAMHRTTGPLTAILERHGIATEEISGAWYNADGSLRPFYEGMSRMASITERVNSVQDRNTMQMRLFGRRVFAGGQMVSGMNRASERARMAYEAMRDPQEMNLRLMAMEEERMRSFGMQMQQLRHGIGELGIGFGEILFGAMDQSGEGFGTYIRNLAEGISVINDMNEGNADARDRFRELNPEIQRQAQELHQFFEQTATGIRAFGRFLRFVGGLIRDFPRLTLAVVALRIALGPGALLQSLSLARAGMLALGRSTTALNFATFRGQSILGTAMSPAVALLGLTIANSLIPHVTTLTSRIGGQEDAYRQLQRATSTQTRFWREQVPIIGNIVAAFIEMGAAAKQALDVTMEIERRRRQMVAEETTAQASTLISGQAERLQEQRGISASEATRMAAQGQMRASEIRAASLMYERGIRGQTEITRHLIEAGMRDMPAALQMSARMAAYQERTAPSALSREAESQVTWRQTWYGGMRDWNRSLNGATAQLLDFATALQEASGPESGSTAAVQEVDDAYVRRGGLISVAGGDVVVSRNHLADAMSASAGAMAGPLPFSGERPMVGPSPTGGGGGGGGALAVPIILNVDGREIARAVGRAEIDQTQRGGGSFRPGDRRSIRETGFRRTS